jgi:integrase
MAKRPEPWYWAARKGWYIQVNKKQILLAKAPQETKIPPKEALQEWHRLMSAEGMVEAKDLRRITVPEIVESFMETKARHKPKTVENYKYILEAIALEFRTARPANVREDDVLRFVTGKDTWGESTKHACVRLIKMVFKWARDKGLMDVNPLAGMDNPWMAGKRERAMDESEYGMMMQGYADESFQLLMEILWETGARPGELCRLDPRHLHPTEPKATLSAAEHKTGRKSGRSKSIHFPEHLMVRLRKLAFARPEGPLLVNFYGGRWTVNAIQKRFRRLVLKGKAPEGLRAYDARHGFVTRKINEGHSVSLVSKAVGHIGTSVTEGVYFNPTAAKIGELFRADISAANSGGSVDMDALAEKVAAKMAALMGLNSKTEGA